MPLVHNEQVKLTANWLSALAAALVAAGVFAPVAALIYGFTPVVMGDRYLFAIAFGCFVLGSVLHLLGRVFLGRLRE